MMMLKSIPRCSVNHLKAELSSTLHHLRPSQRESWDMLGAVAGLYLNAEGLCRDYVDYGSTDTLLHISLQVLQKGP